MAGKMLKCVDCKEDFEFTEGEEAFFKEKFGDDFKPPKRCKPCRKANKQKRDSQDGDHQ